MTLPDHPPSPAAAKKSRNAVVAHFLTRHDPLTSLVLTVPVFLVYHLGILLIDLRNGVDLVSTLTFALLQASVGAYVGVTLAVAAGLVGAGVYLRKQGKLAPRALLPVAVESLVLAIVMAALVGWATAEIFAAQIGHEPLSPIERIVMAAGAGFHEEIVFRVGLFAGGAWVARKLDPERPAIGLIVAAIVSSLIFSAVHYVGGMADQFTLVSFVFRTLAGLYLTAVYQLRGFAVAVYTHTLYDLLVFFVF